MIKTLPLLCVFVYNAFAQCARIENSLYSPADYAVLFPQAQIECVVWDKPDYFAPVSDENGPASPASADHVCAIEISSVHTALFERYNAFCKNVLILQSGPQMKLRHFRQIVYSTVPLFDFSEDNPLSAG